MKEVGSSSDNPSLEELIRKLYDALNDNQTQVSQGIYIFFVTTII